MEHLHCSAKVAQHSTGEMKLHQISTDIGGMTVLHLLVITCCCLCGPVLCSGVPALRKKEHGRNIFV